MKDVAVCTGVGPDHFIKPNINYDVMRIIRLKLQVYVTRPLYPLREVSDESLQLSHVPVADLEILLLLQSKPHNTCID